MPQATKHTAGTRTIAEANPALRDPERHVDIIIMQAVSSAKLEGIAVSDEFIAKLRKKLSDSYVRRTTASIP